MSIVATSWAWQQALPPAQKMVLLALADAHHEETDTCYPGMRTMAKRVGVSPKTVGRHIRELEALGLIERTQRLRPDGGFSTYDYRLMMAAPPLDNLSPAPRTPVSSAPGHSSVPTKNGKANGEEQLFSAGASGGTVSPIAGVTFRGKRVPQPIVEAAERTLAAFGEATGRKLGARSADGKASPALRSVISAMLARPEVTVEEWEAAVRATVANPPEWVSGKLQIGHVFGERAAEWALSNTGRPAARGVSSARAATAERMTAAMERFQPGVALSA